MCEYCAYLYAYINTHVYIFKEKKLFDSKTTMLHIKITKKRKLNKI